MQIKDTLIRIAKELKDYEYTYDPEHEHKPEGAGWSQTKAGWKRVNKTVPPKKPGKYRDQKGRSVDEYGEPYYD